MKQIVQILLFVFPLLFWAQNDKIIEITYVKGYKDYKDTTSSNPKIFKNIEYQLLCSPDEARFEYIDNMPSDADKYNKRYISKGGGNGLYYKSTGSKEKLHQIISPVDDKKYLIKEPFDEYNWKITKEKKVINGYTCYKAISEYEVELPDMNGKMKKSTNQIIVWFTPEINYPFGPAGFDGLPGLVIEKSSNSIYFIASKINFDPKKNKIQKATEGTEITKEAYDEFLKKQVKKFN